MAAQTTVLIVPGWRNSGPDHWQSRWQRKHPDYLRVEQRDWEKPIRAEWVAALDAAVAGAAGPVTLVAHSLGCVTVAHWAAQSPDAARWVTGALHVAPSDVERSDLVAELVGFTPSPRARLPFRSILVASDDDPYSSLAQSRRLAEAWGSELITLRAAGHINTDAGYGPWPQGEALLATLL